MKKTLEEINQEIADLQKQRSNLSARYEEKKKLLVERKAAQEINLIAGNDTSNIRAEIQDIQIDIQGLYRAIKVLDENIEKLQKDRGIEFQFAALALAEEAGPGAIEALKPAYEALIMFVEMNIDAMAKAKELEAKLKAVKRPTPMTNLSHRISRLFQEIERELPLILDSYPIELFKDGSLPKPEELKRRLKSRPTEKNTILNGDLYPPQNLHR
jgi:chromosome segregation ATPase